MRPFARSRRRTSSTLAQKTRQFFAPIVDGVFLPADVASIYAAGTHSQVPLLAGWNADEMRAAVTLRPQKPTAQSFADDARKRFGASADAILKAYPAATDAEALESAAALGSDMFIGYATWKWIESHGASGRVPVYRYSFDRKIPVPPGNTVNGAPATSADIGARHAGEIEYVFGALDISLPKVPWETGDRDAVGRDDDVLVELRQDWRPERSRACPTWPRYDAWRPAGASSRRDDQGRGGRDAAALRGHRRVRGRAARAVTR